MISSKEDMTQGADTDTSFVPGKTYSWPNIERILNLRRETVVDEAEFPEAIEQYRGYENYESEPR